jgi:hypothetical protein
MIFFAIKWHAFPPSMACLATPRTHRHPVLRHDVHDYYNTNLCQQTRPHIQIQAKLLAAWIKKQEMAGICSTNSKAQHRQSHINATALQHLSNFHLTGL